MARFLTLPRPSSNHGRAFRLGWWFAQGFIWFVAASIALTALYRFVPLAPRWLLAHTLPGEFDTGEPLPRRVATLRRGLPMLRALVRLDGPALDLGEGTTLDQVGLDDLIQGAGVRADPPDGPASSLPAGGPSRFRMSRPSAPGRR